MAAKPSAGNFSPDKTQGAEEQWQLREASTRALEAEQTPAQGEGGGGRTRSEEEAGG